MYIELFSGFFQVVKSCHLKSNRLVDTKYVAQETKIQINDGTVFINRIPLFPALSTAFYRKKNYLLTVFGKVAFKNNALQYWVTP